MSTESKLYWEDYLQRNGSVNIPELLDAHTAELERKHRELLGLANHTVKQQSGTIESLRDQAAAKDAEIRNLKSYVAQLESDNANNSMNLDSLAFQLSEANRVLDSGKDRIAALQAEINRLRAKLHEANVEASTMGEAIERAAYDRGVHSARVTEWTPTAINQHDYYLGLINEARKRFREKMENILSPAPVTEQPQPIEALPKSPIIVVPFELPIDWSPEEPTASRELMEDPVVDYIMSWAEGKPLVTLSSGGVTIQCLINDPEREKPKK